MQKHVSDKKVLKPEIFIHIYYMNKEMLPIPLKKGISLIIYGIFINKFGQIFI